jgi:hypothetical protein
MGDLKRVVGFSDYFVTREGVLISLRSKNPRVLKYKESSGGYPYCLCISDKGVRTTLLIHRAIALSYIPNPNNYPCVNHLNGIKNDNRIENLEWCTFSRNSKHAFEIGRTMKKGVDSPKARFNADQVRQIKKMIKSGAGTTAISRIYNCPQSTINNIKRGTRYAEEA